MKCHEGSKEDSTCPEASFLVNKTKENTRFYKTFKIVGFFFGS